MVDYNFVFFVLWWTAVQSSPLVRIMGQPTRSTYGGLTYTRRKEGIFFSTRRTQAQWILKNKPPISRSESSTTEKNGKMNDGLPNNILKKKQKNTIGTKQSTCVSCSKSGKNSRRHWNKIPPWQKEHDGVSKWLMKNWLSKDKRKKVPSKKKTVFFNTTNFLWKRTHNYKNNPSTM